jgi:hypothetical protein
MRQSGTQVSRQKKRVKQLLDPVGAGLKSQRYVGALCVSGVG